MIIGAFLGCLAGGSAAQDRPADLMEVAREKARADKKLLVATALEPTEGEAQSFWPVYNAYHGNMVLHYDRILNLIKTYAGTYETMTDDIAATLLSQYLALEANYAALLKAYAPRFQRVLSARKVVRLYQIENKLWALVNYELAREIPLMEERFRILSDLHGQIQDAFNEVGVQIMSPRFEAQPTQPIIVPPSRWYEPPAARPADAARGSGRAAHSPT